jgi:CRISPR system Cascade subunit CasA
MNLLKDPWLPVRLTSGKRADICVCDIGRRDVVALDFPRLDFNGAVAEFLIGLLTTTFAPEDESAWKRLWVERPSPETLQAAFEPVLAAFEADIFMQRDVSMLSDAETLDERTSDRLLLDNLSGSTSNEKRDILNRAGRLDTMALPIAIAALITLQVHANQGGRGAYQCVRGGGAMTVLARYDDTLWGLVWPNVETRGMIRGRAIGAIPDATFAPFPWMWDMSDDLGPDNRHPCLVYWATPRRVKLKIENSNTATCSLSGEPAAESVASFSYLSGGPKFIGWIGHPLSATEQKARNGELVRVTLPCPTDRIGMQHWLGLVQENAGNVSPAACVANARLRRRVVRDARLVVHGYAAAAATVSAWHSAEMPLFLSEDETIRRVAAQLVAATEKAAKAVDTAVKRAQGLPTAKDSRKKYIRELAKTAYGIVWREVESEFFAALAKVSTTMASDGDDPTRDIREAFYVSLRRAAYRVVDATCPDDILAPRHAIAAHLSLRKILLGKAMVNALALPPRERTATKKTRTAA